MKEVKQSSQIALHNIKELLLLTETKQDIRTIVPQTIPLKNQKVEREIYAHKWNGSQFAYNTEFSDQAYSQLSTSCEW